MGGCQNKVSSLSDRFWHNFGESQPHLTARAFALVYDHKRVCYYLDISTCLDHLALVKETRCSFSKTSPVQGYYIH